MFRESCVSQVQFTMLRRPPLRPARFSSISRVWPRWTSWLVFRKNVDRRLLLGAFAIVAGAMVLSWNGQTVRFEAGAGLIAAACVAWGIDNNLTCKLSSADPVVTTIIKGLVAGGVNVSLALLSGSALPSAGAIGAAALVGFFGVGVSLVLFVLALRHLGTARTGAYFSLAPFIGAVVALALLHEPDASIAARGIADGPRPVLHLAERHEHEHQHDTLEHEHSHVHDEHHQHRHDAPAMQPHSHWHRHEPIRPKQPHYPDLHHRHGHR